MEDEEIESGSDDGHTHQQLLQQVESFTRSSRSEQRTEGAAVASEYHLTSTDQGDHVSLSSVLTGLGGVGNKSLLALKQRLSTVEGKNAPVEPPLNRIQADRANRKAANQQSCVAVGKWAPIVKKNREAEHLTFPLQQEYIPPPSLSTKLESFTPTTELEKEVAAILASSENVESMDQELTESERKSLFEMTMEEVTERKKALQKHRALVSYFEQKCRRVRRIKSKKFHKVRRKRLEKLGSKSDVSEEELAKLRVKERMTLKHSSRAKWAKKQHTREHRDPATQQALSEHHNKKIQLKQKVVEEEEETDSDDGGEQEEVGEEEEELDAGRSVKEGGSNSRHGNPWLSNSGQGTNEERDKTHGSLSGKRAGLHVSQGVIDTGSFIVAEGGEGLGVASKQLLAVREAFAGDNVVEEFEKEKAELESRETQVDAPVILPGWGSWGGEGVRPPKKPLKMQPRPPKKRRKDAGMRHVIISEEKQDKNIMAHLVQSVPWPYMSKDQFDKTHSTPVGRHWNTEDTFQQLIKPRVTTFSGEVIEPLELTEEVQSYLKRTGGKRDRKKRKTDKKLLK